MGIFLLINKKTKNKTRMKNSSQSILDVKQAVVETGKIIPVLFAVSVAVGAPPAAAIVTAGVGGVVLMIGTLLSGAVLATRGPSLALLVVFASVIATMGYQGALAVFFMAGLFQAVLGVTHTGKYLLRWLSPVAAKGMLSALALTLLVSQLMTWFTGTAVPTASLLDQALLLPFVEHSEKSFMIGFFALALLAIHQLVRHLSPKQHWSHQAPVGVIVMVVAGLLALVVGDQSFMAAPQMGMILPSFHLAETWEFWYAVVLVAVCGLLETFGQQQLHTNTMKVSKNIAVIGLSNIVTAVFGGLPMQTKAYRPDLDEDLAMYRVVTRLCTAALVAQMLIWVMILPIVQSIPVVAGATLLVFLSASYIYTTAKSVWYSKKTIAIFAVAVLSTLLTDQPLLALLTATMVHKLWNHLDMEMAKPMFVYDVAVKQQDEAVYEIKLTPTDFRGEPHYLTTVLSQVPAEAEMHISLVGGSILNPTLQKTLNQVASQRIGKVVLVTSEGDDDDQYGEVFPPYHLN